MKKIISMSNVVKTYNKGECEVSALKGINLDIYQGELVVILGSSGSGKSTLLNILGGLDLPSQGSVICNEKNISRATEKELTNYRRNEVGFVFQAYNLVQNLTAYENVALAAKLTKSDMHIDEALDAVELTHRKHNFPYQMSGGEQQRTSIARALVKKPKIMFCDEPTGALDHETGKKVLKILEKLVRVLGNTVVIVTHNAAISGIADRVITMRSGQIIGNIINEKPLTVEGIEL